LHSKTKSKSRINSLDHNYQAKKLDINKNNNYQYKRHNPNKK